MVGTFIYLVMVVVSSGDYKRGLREKGFPLLTVLKILVSIQNGQKIEMYLLHYFKHKKNRHELVTKFYVSTTTYIFIM